MIFTKWIPVDLEWYSLAGNEFLNRQESWWSRFLATRNIGRSIEKSQEGVIQEKPYFLALLIQDL